MSTSTTIYAGAVAPETFVQTFTASDLQFAIDLATVTAAVFKTRDPDGDLADWTATISYNATTQVLTVTHVFAAGPPSEVTNVGTWAVYAALTVPGGVVPTKPRALIVLDQYAIV